MFSKYYFTNLVMWNTQNEPLGMKLIRKSELACSLLWNARRIMYCYQIRLWIWTKTLKSNANFVNNIPKYIFFSIGLNYLTDFFTFVWRNLF